MTSNKRKNQKNYGNKNHIIWCLKQNKGIKLEKTNEDLCEEYLRKARSSLNMLDAAIERNETDWIVTTAYYARYFSLYALLQKCGIKSEIHDCTISIMRYLFVKENIIDKKLFDELILAKDLRVDVQYYVDKELDLKKVKKDCETAREFVLEIEQIVENISDEKINNIRTLLKIIESQHLNNIF